MNQTQPEFVGEAGGGKASALWLLVKQAAFNTWLFLGVNRTAITNPMCSSYELCRQRLRTVEALEIKTVEAVDFWRCNDRQDACRTFFRLEPEISFTHFGNQSKRVFHGKLE